MKATDVKDLAEFFRQQGFTAVKAELWANFARHVFQIYWSAADQLLEQENWEAFKQKRGAVGKPKSVGKKVVQIPIEDAITSELGNFANLLRLGLPTRHFLRTHEVKFECEALVPSKTRAGRHSKKVDFRACAQTAVGAPEIAIEAKPITATGDIAGRYLGTEGIGCFFSAESAYTTGPLGAMLAYTITDPLVSMRDHVHSAMGLYKPSPEKVEKVLLTDSEWVTCTSHLRDHSMQPIAILHVERNFPLIS